MAGARRPAGGAASAAGRLYPVDMKEEKPEVLEAAAQEYCMKISEQPSSAASFFSMPGREKVEVEASSMRFLPLYGQDSKRTLLVLNDSRQKDTVLAIYFHNSWWTIEDVLKTADGSREGLIQVQTFGERIVLFVLNCIIFGTRERSLTWDAVFMPHSEEEHAKLFWRSGEAAAFYTVKAKGSLCDEHSSQCYQLPVLDTIFVRKKFRRCGLGTAMLQDFCETFAAEDALGISRPVSAEMYQVCQRFLGTHPEEQSRLWEVEAPGDWSRRTNIWLTVQMTQNITKKGDQGDRTDSCQDNEPERLDETRKKGTDQVPNIQVSQEQTKEFKDACDELLDSQPGVEGRISQQGGGMHQCKELKTRVRRGGPIEDRAPKQLKVASYDGGSSS